MDQQQLQTHAVIASQSSIRQIVLLIYQISDSESPSFHRITNSGTNIIPGCLFARTSHHNFVILAFKSLKLPFPHRFQRRMFIVWSRSYAKSSQNGSPVAPKTMVQISSEHSLPPTLSNALLSSGSSFMGITSTAPIKVVVLCMVLHNAEPSSKLGSIPSNTLSSRHVCMIKDTVSFMGSTTTSIELLCQLDIYSKL